MIYGAIHFKYSSSCMPVYEKYVKMNLAPSLKRQFEAGNLFKIQKYNNKGLKLTKSGCWLPLALKLLTLFIFYCRKFQAPFIMQY